MKTTRTALHAAIAIAPCSYLLDVANDTNLIELQVTPAGAFRPADGRPMDVDAWRIDTAIASRVIERFNARRQPVVIDYEHQTLRKEENGQPAPAAAWFKELKWKEGEGLFATVELTSTARQLIANKEYLYFSPVFQYDAKTGEVLAIEMGALTNTPAIHGMAALGVRAAATFIHHPKPEDPPVNKLLSALLAALGLSAETTEEQAIAALNARLDADPLSDLRKALGVDEKADAQTLVAACTALKAKSTGNPDPAQYAPIAVMTQLQKEVAVLTAKLKERDNKDVDAMIEKALNDGRLLKPMEGWARELAKNDIAALTSYLTAAAPIAALTGSQTGGQAPVADEKTGLTETELAVCSSMGITPEAFKAAKPA